LLQADFQDAVQTDKEYACLIVQIVHRLEEDCTHHEVHDISPVQNGLSPTIFLPIH